MRPADEAGGGAAHHRGGADLLVAEHPEQLAEAVEPFLEQPRDRFVGAVARRDAGSAGRDDACDVRVRELPLDRAAHELGGSSLTIVRPVTWWPAREQQIGDRPAARVGGLRAGVADRHDRSSAPSAGACALVLDVAHLGGILTRAGRQWRAVVHLGESDPSELDVPTFPTAGQDADRAHAARDRLRARWRRWVTHPIISGSRRKCSASATRRPISRAG